MSVRFPFHLSCWLSLSLGIAVAACGGSASSTGNPGDDGGASTDDGGAVDAQSEAALDGGSDGPGNDASDPGDGPPSYTASCTPLSQQTGTAINTFHGRLDGYLVYVVPKGGPGSCNGDQSHVHLQIKMKGNVYDVAVDIGKFAGDSLLYEADMPLPQGAWSEGWHNLGLSYPQLGVHSTQFMSEDPATLGQKIQSELAGVNHISVFGESYTQMNGCHNVHYQNGTLDGAIVIHPLSATPHILFFRFSTDTF